MEPLVVIKVHLFDLESPSALHPFPEGAGISHRRQVPVMVFYSV